MKICHPLFMKTVAKIDPEKEYENAKKLIEIAGKNRLNKQNASSLDSSVDNLITAARVLMEREEQRRGKKKPPVTTGSKGRKRGDLRKDAKKLPSEKFPNIEVKEETISQDHPPICPCCNEVMKESGLFTTTEKLEVIPKTYYIMRTKRVKYNCSTCHGAMTNTPAVPSIIPSSNYGDSLIVDVSLSKYCDLIPIDRYAQIAARDGLEGLPPQSLIELTHHLAKFLRPIYENIKKEILQSKVLHADETPHKMLEGDEKFNWYLWGFFATTGCCFEAHNTRSGDVAAEFIKESSAKYLVTDSYSGYNKSIRVVNEEYNKSIVAVACNAHAYRYFKDAKTTWDEDVASPIKLYKEIYKLERERNESNLSEEEQLVFRKKMIPLFEAIKEFCQKDAEAVMPGSSLKKSINYFLNHYKELTVCTTDITVPLDNNLSEREMRAPVVGRKTWLGNHSKRGALTSSLLFSLVHSCKMNKINPRNYFPWVVQEILDRGNPLTPFEYSKLLSD